MILAIDPGLRGCGVAYFGDAADGHPPELVFATWVKNPCESGRGPEAWKDMAHAVMIHPYFSSVDEMAVELPQVYPGMPKTDVNDLLDLAGVLGAITGSSTATVKHFFPADWKAQVPKKIMNERVKGFLSMFEKSRIVSVGALDHNTYDGIGIGLFYLKRMKRGGAK